MTHDPDDDIDPERDVESPEDRADRIEAAKADSEFDEWNQNGRREQAL